MNAIFRLFKIIHYQFETVQNIVVLPGQDVTVCLRLTVRPEMGGSPLIHHSNPY
jgi:hypothetical protein